MLKKQTETQPNNNNKQTETKQKKATFRLAQLNRLK